MYFYYSSASRGRHNKDKIHRRGSASTPAVQASRQDQPITPGTLRHDCQPNLHTTPTPADKPRDKISPCTIAPALPTSLPQRAHLSSNQPKLSLSLERRPKGVATKPSQKLLKSAAWQFISAEGSRLSFDCPNSSTAHHTEELVGHMMDYSGRRQARSIVSSADRKFLRNSIAHLRESAYQNLTPFSKVVASCMGSSS